MAEIELGFVLDTNVISETAKDKSNPRVMEWLEAQSRLRISAITLYEIADGVERLRAGRRRSFLEEWLATLLAGSIDILEVGARAALSAARLGARTRAVGRPIEDRDLLIAATAEVAGLGIATRNVDHFRGLGISVLDPFTMTRAV